MDRRNFLQISGLGSALTMTSLSNAKAGQSNDPPSKVSSPPVVMAPREDGVEIGWRVNRLSKGYVEYGETEKLGSVARGDTWGLRPAGDEAISVRIDDLKPGLTYYYRVVTESFNHKKPQVEKGAVRTFTTLDASKKTNLFSVWNDTHKNAAVIKGLQEITPKSDFLLWNGDISNDWHKEGEVAASLLAPEGVDFTKDHPLVILRGNHDLRGVYAHQFEDVAATPNGLPWFAFRSGPIAAICMDTGEDKADEHPYLFGRVDCEPMRKVQAEWLAKVIEDPAIKDAPYKILFCHIPLICDKEGMKNKNYPYNEKTRDLWHDSLVKWGAQVVISGHTHRPYVVEANEEFPYIQVIGGGKTVDSATLITGRADENSLEVVCKSLANKKLFSTVIKPQK